MGTWAFIVGAACRPPNQPGDLSADVILGQPEFGEVTPGPTRADRLYLPHGVIVDARPGAGNRFYVYDAGHNRVLGFDGTCLTTPPCQATLTLGQPALDTSTCNGDSGFQAYPNRAPATAATLCGEQEAQLSISEGGSGASMAIDPSGNLYVTDFWNHRVLRYDDPFAPGQDAEADEVWGQADFAGNACNRGAAAPDAASFCFTWGNSNNWTAGVHVQPDGTLWVVDSGNNRVLRFAPGSKTANLVLGQPNFTSRNPGTGLHQMTDPSAVRVTAQGWVYVAEHNNGSNSGGRVTIFKPPFSNGMTASVARSFASPSGVDLDPTRPGIWVANERNQTLELWDENLAVKLDQIGQPGNGNLLGDASGSIGIDSAGNVAVAIGIGDYSDDVILFRRTGGTWAAPVRLFDANVPIYTAEDLGGAVSGVAWSASPPNGLGITSQLVVAESGRILFWNDPNSSTMTNHEPADGWLDWLSCDANGQNCVPVIDGFDDANFACCTALKASNGHLWAAMGTQHDNPDRILVWELPLTSDELPVKDIRLPFAVLGGGQIPFAGTFKPFWGLAPAPDASALWVTQTFSNRVLRIRTPLGATPLVDVVLGQATLSGTLCNRGGSATASTLCLPGSLSLDRFGNLWVSDHSLEIQGNRRLLEFNAALFPANNPSVIFGSTASKIFPNVATWEPAFASGNQMVVGYNPYHGSNPEPPGDTQPGTGWFPGVYPNPLGPSTMPVYFLKDYHSMAFAAAFDDADNLYVADLNRARVLVYRDLFPQVLRPSAQGAWAQWGFATPNQAHWLNVREVTPDDDASHFNDQQWHRKDTQLYPSAGLPAGAVVQQVTFRFRWKHFDTFTPNPAGPNMWAIFRQSGVDTRGPTYQSTNAAGWRTDAWTMTTNPRTGLAWTVADLNAGLEFGFEIYPTGGAWNYVTQTWIEITAQ